MTKCILAASMLACLTSVGCMYEPYPSFSYVAIDRSELPVPVRDAVDRIESGRYGIREVVLIEAVIFKGDIKDYIVTSQAPEAMDSKERVGITKGGEVIFWPPEGE